MSRGNVEAARVGYEAWNRGDFDAFFETLHPEIEWVLPEGGPNTGTLRGRQAVREFVESYLDSFEAWRVEPERFFDAGDGQVVVFVCQSGRGRGSGIVVEDRLAHVIRQRNGKAWRLHVFPDRKAALEAVGLAE